MAQRTKLDSFVAVDKTNTRYVIIKYAKLIESDEIRGDRMSEPPTRTEYFETQRGQEVLENDDGTFVIMASDTRLTRV
jgi:hypothetical protein